MTQTNLGSVLREHIDKILSAYDKDKNANLDK